MEYKDQLKSRVEDYFKCSKCSKIGVEVAITQEDRIWEVKATCSGSEEYIYSADPSFRGYVEGQYKYILKKEKPGTKIRFVEATSKYIIAAPSLAQETEKLREFKFSHSTLPKYKKK